jgi:uncharacterized membrane protein YcaP (DUF421 family)
MEVLKIEANGQWSLVEKQEAPKVDPKSLALLPPKPDKPYLSYKDSDLQGNLREDHGRKGWLHNSSNSRPPRQQSKEHMQGKMPTPIKDFKGETNPGIGV